MRPLDGYPTSWGSTRASVAPIAGPTSYAPIVLDSPPGTPTGGHVIEAVQFGLTLIDLAFGSLTDSAIYYVRTIPVSPSDTIRGSSQPTYRLVWYIEATGAEVATGTNLSTEIVRVLAIGPK